MVRMSTVVYLGQKHTRLSLIRKTANLHPESPMRKKSIVAVLSRIYDLNSSIGPA